MNINYKILTGFLVLTLNACSFQSPKVNKKHTAPQSHLSREEVKAAWDRSMSLTEEHKILEKLAGDWQASVKFWTQPATPANVSSAKSSNKIILNGKFLVEDYRGSFAGQPFQGMSIMGYDTILKKFSNYWADNMGTGAIYSEGTFDPQTNTINLDGQVTDPITQSKKPTFSSLKLIDENSHILEMYDVFPDGNKFKTLEIEYKRGQATAPKNEAAKK